MSKKIQLNIADPCHENWDNMTEVDKGRFCASCQKQVIDFTNMSDTQVAAFFKKPSTGSVCGRFFQDQLDRDIEIPKKRIPWVKYFFQFALPAFLVSMKATAQGNVKARHVTNTESVPVCSQLTGVIGISREKMPKLTGDTIVTPVQKQNELNVLLQGKPKMNTDVVSSVITLKGMVLNENNDPVPFASVMIKGTKNGVMANSSGIFTIKKNIAEKEMTLQVSSVGYIENEMLINKETDVIKELVIHLKQQVMDEVVVVGYGAMMERTVVGSVATTTKKEEKEKPKEVPPRLSKEMEDLFLYKPVIKSPPGELAMIKVYPNPVLSGTNINIGCQKLEEGYYVIQLSTQSGQQVLNKQTWIDGETQVLNIDIPNVAAGVYFLRMTNKETSKRFTQKIIIQ